MYKSVNLYSVALVLMCALLWPDGGMAAWGSGGESVLLKDIEVLTLYNGKMTQGRRSSPVAQLECVKGGTASCDAYRPRVVQCYNRGWDGVDVQWECKTDMDNAYRFGEVEVSCEGYSSRDDPYVLKGSCGLRYSLDYTKEGHQQQKQHNYYGDSGNQGYSGGNHGNQGYSSSYQGSQKLSGQSWIADMIVLCAVCLVGYALYKTCVGSRNIGEDARSTTNDDHPHGGGGGGGGYGWFGRGANQRPSAPGFRPEYTDNASCGGNATSQGASGSGGSGAGGFWTGAMTGGLLGYMFGNSGRRGQGQWGGGGGNWGGGNWGGGNWARGGGGGGWGGGGGGGGWSGGGGGGGSTGTRTASGFGGTSRR